MCMLKTPPFPPPPPPSGKNHIWKYFPDSACGAIFLLIIYKQQFVPFHAIPNQWNFTSATLNDIRFVFYHNIKDNERNLYQDLLTIENTDSDLTVQALYYANESVTSTRQTFLSKTFANSLNMQKNMRKNV